MRWLVHAAVVNAPVGVLDRGGLNTDKVDVEAIDSADLAEENLIRQGDIVLPVIGPETGRGGQVGVLMVVMASYLSELPACRLGQVILRSCDPYLTTKTAGKTLCAILGLRPRTEERRDPFTGKLVDGAAARCRTTAERLTN